LVIETAPMPAIPAHSINLFLSSYAKISPRALPVQFKLCQGLNSTLARMEASDNHCFDALLLNEQGHICETASANIFWFAHSTLYTPALSCGLLDGATRATIMRLSPYPVREVAASIDALLDAEAVFITNVLVQALAVHQLLPHTKQWASDVITDEFRAILSEDRMDFCDASHQ
jgi:branched-subunit amino acid aminotransferase/4-amino-4-deoxychorismate lyase